MAIVVKDRVKETSTTTGTGTITLAGAVAGFQAFSAIGNGNVTYFAIVDNATGAWEVNYGTYTASGTTLTRNNPPLSSSNAGALVNFAANPKDVFCTYPSEKAIYEEVTGNVLIDGGPITVIGTGVTSYTTFSAALGELYANINNFAQLYAQNLNNGSEASADFVAYNNLGNGVNNFVDLGINSSNYTSATYPIFTPGSAYVFNDGGEMIIGSATNDLLLFAGGVATTDWALRIDKTSKLLTTKAALTLGGALTGVGGSFTAPVTTTSSMTSPGSTELVTRTYVDSAVSTGFVVHPAVRAATPAGQNLGVIYNNGTAGVGATITADTNRIFTTIDGVGSWSIGQRLLVKDQTSSFQNGVYTLTNLGSAGVSPWVATRATDFDTVAAGEVANNAYFYVTSGTTNAGSSWVLNQLAAITVGTTALPFDLFASGLVYTGGTNIDVTGQVISLTGTVAATNGGTGTNTVTTGDLLYGSASDVWSKLPLGAAYKSLIVNAAGTQLEWNATPLNQPTAVSGQLGFGNGGTGASTQQAAINALAGATTSAQYLRGDGTNVVMSAIQGADVPILNQNTTGTAANVTGTVAVANGGTGQTTYTDGQLLIGNTSGNTLTKATLTQGTGITITNGNGSITIAATGGGGGVTSVTGTAPVVSSGGATPAISLAANYGDTLNPYASKTANFFLAAPNATAGAPTFRAIVKQDIPTLDQNTTGTAANITATTNGTLTTLSALSLPGSQVTGNIGGNAANVTGTVAIANGGTGQTSQTAAFDALSPTTTKGDLIVSNGTDNIRLPVGTNTHVLTADSTEPSGLKWAAGGAGSGTVTSVDATVPSFLSVSGNPITTSGTLAFGLSSTPANGQLLIGNGTGFSYANLSAGTGISITNGAGSIQITATGGGPGGGLTQAEALKLVSLRL